MAFLKVGILAKTSFITLSLQGSTFFCRKNAFFCREEPSFCRVLVCSFVMLQWSKYFFNASLISFNMFVKCVGSLNALYYGSSGCLVRNIFRVFNSVHSMQYSVYLFRAWLIPTMSSINPNMPQDAFFPWNFPISSKKCLVDFDAMDVCIGF